MKLKKLFTVLILLTYLSGCRRNSSEYLIVVDKFDNEYDLKGEQIKTNIMFGIPILIEKMDTLIFVTDAKAFHQTQKMVFIFNERNFDLVGKCVAYGIGPGEFNYVIAMASNKAKNKFWIFDDERNNIACFPIDSVLRNNNYLPKAFKNNVPGLNRIAVINDSVLVGCGDIPDRRLAFFNNEGKIIDRKGNYPKIKGSDKPGNNYFYLFFSFMSLNRDAQKIVLASGFTDIINIYNLSGDLEREIRLKDEKTIYFNKKGGYILQYRCYLAVKAGKDKFYALYDGSSIDEGQSLHQGHYIQVYNYEGKPLCRYELDIPVFNFEIDEENGILYGINTELEQPLIKYNLNEAILK